ncbi:MULTISPECIES: hypothetical protein [Bacteroidales]|uniref:hypothetical protein n=1 Tax=Bacteroidales TaxID=171549 RepID=UPI0035A008D7
MEKIIIGAIVLYALFAGILLWRLNVGKRRRKEIIGRGGSWGESRPLKSDIVGKSRFDLSASKPLTTNPKPLAASSQKTENPDGKADNFAPPNEERPTAEVPPDELNEIFSDTLSEEENPPMAIDYPLEYETESDLEEEEEVAGMAGAALASGVRFEDLGNVVRTVNQADSTTPQQRQKAGETLLEIRQTDLFEQLVSGKPDAKRMVTDLITESLAAFYERKEQEAGMVGSDRKAPADFNINDYIPGKNKNVKTNR